MLKRPKIEENLVVVMATDLEKELIEIYRKIEKSKIGNFIKEIYQVKDYLIDWRSVEEAENKIPYIFSSNTKLGERIWYLSNNQSSHYYYGFWFDYKKSNTKNRNCRVMCKLSNEAIKTFNAYQKEFSNENKP